MSSLSQFATARRMDRPQISAGTRYRMCNGKIILNCRGLLGECLTNAEWVVSDSRVPRRVASSVRIRVKLIGKGSECWMGSLCTEPIRERDGLLAILPERGTHKWRTAPRYRHKLRISSFRCSWQMRTGSDVALTEEARRRNAAGNSAALSPEASELAPICSGCADLRRARNSEGKLDFALDSSLNVFAGARAQRFERAPRLCGPRSNVLGFSAGTDFIRETPEADETPTVFSFEGPSRNFGTSPPAGLAKNRH